MGDHFVLLVDRLLTESSVEAVIQSRNRLQHASSSVSEQVMTSFSFNRMEINVEPSTMKLGQCRICHDEDEESNMEVPCSCRGSLKYTHRKCVQRWCNEKGDTICEICHQEFKPGYIAPSPLFHYGGIPFNFRGDWEISRSGLNNPQLITTVSTDENFLDSNFDEYPIPTSRSLICCRIVAIIFMVLLVLRHTLPFILYDGGEYSISIFLLLLLRTIGILLPIYIMAKAFTTLQRRRNRQVSPLYPLPSSDEESELPQLHLQQSHLIHVP